MTVTFEYHLHFLSVLTKPRGRFQFTSAMLVPELNRKYMPYYDVSVNSLRLFHETSLNSRLIKWHLYSSIINSNDTVII